MSIRNTACACGSGKKAKRCCQAPVQPMAERLASAWVLVLPREYPGETRLFPVVADSGEVPAFSRQADAIGYVLKHRMNSYRGCVTTVAVSDEHLCVMAQMGLAVTFQVEGLTFDAARTEARRKEDPVHDLS